MLVATLLIVGMTSLVFRFAGKMPFLATGWFWFLGTLIPVIGIVQVGLQSMADRYTYIPYIGLFIVISWTLGQAGMKSPGLRMSMGIAAGCALAACGVITHNQASVWRDSESLFRHTVTATRNNYLAYNNLGFHLANSGRTEEAIEAYRKSISINPRYVDALNNLGHALAGQGKHAEALPLLFAALREKPRHPEVHNNLGNSLSEVGKLDEAIQHYQIALENQAGPR